MKIGFSSLAMHYDNMENILDFAVDNEFKYLEIIFDFPRNENDFEILNSYDLNYSIHSPMADMNIASLNKNIRNASLDEIKKSIDFANSIDAETLVLHPGHMAFLNKDHKELGIENSHNSIVECRDYAEGSGLEICVENMPKIPGFLYNDIYKLESKLKELNLPMTMDIGHAHTNGFKANEMSLDCVKHIHLSDNNGRFDEHLALGDGTIDLKTVFDSFKKKNFNGTYLIEVNEKEDILKSLDYIKNI